MTGRKRKDAGSTLPPAAEPLTPESLRLMLAGRVLKHGERLPAPTTLKEMARDINGFRDLHLRYTKNWKPSDEQKLRARAASEVLLSYLPHLRSETEVAKPHFAELPKFAMAMLKRDLIAIAAVETGLKQLLHESLALLPITTLAPPAERWEHLAETVASIFRDAMRRNNPNVAFGRSNDGPVPRFVAMVTPHITGETPSVASVGQKLKRLARDKRRLPKPD